MQVCNVGCDQTRWRALFLLRFGPRRPARLGAGLVVVERPRWRSLVSVALRTSPAQARLGVGLVVVERPRWRSLVLLRFGPRRPVEAVLGWLWSGDPGGEALFLLRFGPRRPRRVWVLGWLWSSDPGGEALFLLHFGPRRPRRVWVLGWLWSSDPGGEALFLLHFGPRRPRNAGCGLVVVETLSDWALNRSYQLARRWARRDMFPHHGAVSQGVKRGTVA